MRVGPKFKDGSNRLKGNTNPVFMQSVDGISSASRRRVHFWWKMSCGRCHAGVDLSLLESDLS